MKQILSFCPVCDSDRVNKALSVIDHSVSKETFEVWECNNCSLRFTQDIPNAESIGRYYQSEEYVSHSDTQKGIVNQLYHKVRKRALRDKRETISGLLGADMPQKLLDIGCGTGAFLNEMKLAGWNVSGLEPDHKARMLAEKNYQIKPQTPETLFKLPKEVYSVVTMWHVLEHVHTLHEYVAQIHRILLPNGLFLVAVPNYTSLDAQYYGKHWAAYDVPRHLYHFSPESMKTLMQHHHFDVEQVLPMPFDSFYVSMLSEKYKHGGSGFLMGGFHGFRSWLHARRNPTTYSSLLYVMRKK